MKIKSPKDFWSGLMFLGFGLFFVIWAAIYYQMGTAVRMGPAYFPVLLGGLLAVLGLLILLESFVVEGPPVPAFALRPLILLSVGCVLYGYLMKPLGLFVATLALNAAYTVDGAPVSVSRMKPPFSLLICLLTG